MTPPEASQEGPQRGWHLDHTTQHTVGTTSAQRVGVVNAVTTGQCRGHQGQQLVSRVGSARSAAQVNVAVNQVTQTQALGQSARQDLPGIGYQAVIVESDLYAIRVIAWQHPIGAPGFGSVFCFKTIIPEAGSTFSSPQHDATLILSVDWG